MKIDHPQIATDQTHTMSGLFHSVKFRRSADESFTLTLQVEPDNIRYFHFRDSALGRQLMSLPPQKETILNVTFQGTDWEDFDGELLSINCTTQLGTNYEVKENGKVYISEMDFNNVHGDYKKSFKYFGENTMLVLDPVTGGTVCMPVVFKENAKKESK